MGSWRYLIFIVLIAFLGWGVYGIVAEKGKVGDTADTLRVELGGLEEENRGLEADNAYYENEQNLVKALKEQFNYRAADEKLIILVSPSPKSSSTATSTE
ncbi:MAG: hypothetical protein HYU81_00160 [Candidatus Brennerbacteria bacterium]|nr:hypothetical protein [Candidatus Brennerbacteria bacterium]